MSHKRTFKNNTFLSACVMHYTSRCIHVTCVTEFRLCKVMHCKTLELHLNPPVSPVFLHPVRRSFVCFTSDVNRDKKQHSLCLKSPRQRTEILLHRDWMELNGKKKLSCRSRTESRWENSDGWNRGPAVWKSHYTDITKRRGCNKTRSVRSNPAITGHPSYGI